MIDLSHIKITQQPLLPNLPKATDIRFDDHSIIFVLSNGGQLIFPLRHFPRLAQATPEQRQQWRLVWQGEAIRWDELDEDISVRQLLTGEC